MSKATQQKVQHAGKITIAMLMGGIGIFVLALVFDIGQGGHVASVQATSTATTTVTVLNTPPTWLVTAYEVYPSSTTTPTNSGTSTVWTATASDSNGESYRLLICKASSTPTPVNGGAPVCGGGSANQWGVSASTASAAAATVSTTTTEAMAEKNDWFAYVCDENAGSARCNAAMYNGTHEAGAASATSSPFVVNHRPTFTAFADDSPTLPGATVTWTTTASDADTLGSADTVQLHICKAADFNTTTGVCGAGGFWASSTFSASNPSTSTSLTIPLQDKNFAAYGYVIDNNLHPATGGQQGVDSVLTISNATPSVSSSTIAVYDVFGTTSVDTTLALTTEEGQTSNFVMRFTVTDNNSCEADGGGQEISDVDINVFRSGVGGTIGLGCDSISEFNTNNCYTHTATSTWWAPTCYQVPNGCTGSTTATVEWECKFPLWYTADPTDVGSVYAAEDWRGSARATDDDGALGNYSTDDEAANGASQMTQFLSFRATGSPIAYGSLEPGQDTGTHKATTTVYATGNTGLDQYLSGAAMCVTYPSCTNLATSTIFVPYQHFSLSNATAYAAGTQLSTSTAPTFVNAVITKTTATSTPTSDDTYWAIAVPSSITFAGDYIGRNFIDAVVAPSGEW
jgi:hypothetical protein